MDSFTQIRKHNNTAPLYKYYWTVEMVQWGFEHPNTIQLNRIWFAVIKASQKYYLWKLDIKVSWNPEVFPG